MVLLDTQLQRKAMVSNRSALALMDTYNNFADTLWNTFACAWFSSGCAASSTSKNLYY
jgi:hypothetical protein